jgi:hypothetical protein
VGLPALASGGGDPWVILHGSGCSCWLCGLRVFGRRALQEEMSEGK